MKRLGPFGTLFVFILGISAFQVAYVVAGVEPTPGTVMLMGMALSLSLVCWAVADAHSRARLPCHDFGFLMAVFLPVSLVYYVVWSRGWKGLITLAALLGLFLLPMVIAVAASVVKVVIG